MNKLIATTFLLSFFAANALAYQGYGIGMKSCGSWVEARNKEDFYSEGQWVLGYLTAYGYYGTEHLKEVDSGAILTFMDNYCREKPLDDIEIGAQALINALKKK